MLLICFFRLHMTIQREIRTCQKQKYQLKSNQDLKNCECNQQFLVDPDAIHIDAICFLRLGRR